MNKPSVSKKATLAKTKPDGLTTLLTEVRQLIQSARRGVSTVVDTFQVMTNFEIGRHIVEHEQKGAKRAASWSGAVEGAFGAAHGRAWTRLFSVESRIHEEVLPRVAEPSASNTPDSVWDIARCPNFAVAD